MSMYISFYITDNANKMVELFTLSRASCVYEMFEEYTPYERITPVTGELLNKVKTDITQQIEKWDLAIKRVNDTINFLKDAAMDAAESLERFDACQHEIAEYKEIKREIKNTRGVVSTLEMIRDNYKYVNGVNCDAVIYVGIEVDAEGKTFEEANAPE